MISKKMITGVEVAIEYWGEHHRMVVIRQTVEPGSPFFLPGYHHHNYPIRDDKRLNRAHQLQKLLMHQEE